MEAQIGASAIENKPNEIYYSADNSIFNIFNALTFIDNTRMCKDSLNDAYYLLTHLKV